MDVPWGVSGVHSSSLSKVLRPPAYVGANCWGFLCYFVARVWVARWVPVRGCRMDSFPLWYTQTHGTDSPSGGRIPPRRMWERILGV